MKKLIIRKDVDLIIVENEQYIPAVQCVGSGINIDIGVDYTYLQYSNAAWFENYYVDLNNTIKPFDDDITELLNVIVTGWEQPLGQEGNPTPEQKAQKARDELMLKGFEYNGVQVSVTKDDGDGMVQVKASFELGLTSTVIHFSNGSKLPMTAEEFPKFALQFVTERGKFFS